MDEKDILLLQGLGYKVVGGAIIDSNGKYLPSIDYNGRQIKSFRSQESYDTLMQKKQILEQVGFQEDPSSPNNIATQKEVALAKEHIKLFEQDAASVNTPDFKDPIYEEAFKEYQKEDKKINKGTFPNPQTLQQTAEKGTVLEDLETEEEKTSYKEINNRIKEIQAIDPDNDTLLKERINQDTITSGFGGMPIINPGKDASWLEKLNYKTSKFVDDAVSGIIEKFTPAGVGMEDKALKEEYLDLKEKRHQLLKPVATKKLNNVENIISTYESQIKAWQDAVKETSLGSPERLELFKQEKDIEKYNYVLRRLKKQQNNLQDFINNKNYDTSIFSVENAMDFGSFGILDITDKLIYDLPIARKIDNNEELTESEKAIFNASIIENDIANAQFEQKFWHETTGGLNESMKFLAGGIGGRAVGKTATKLIGRELSGLTNKVVGGFTDVAVQSLLHPATYEGALDKYIGEFDVRKDENDKDILLAGSKLYNTLTDEVNFKIDKVDEQLAVALESGDKEKVAELKKQKDDLLEAKSRIKSPASVGESLVFGVTENFKENFSEKYGGKIYNRIGLGRLEKGLTNSKMGNALFGNKVSKFVGSTINAGKDKFNKAFGAVPGDKIIGSNMEEIFEEILVQATPTYGSTMGEYYDQVSELATVDFYTKVAAQTLLMQKTFQTGGLAQKYYNIATMTGDERAKMKEINKLYKEVGNRNLSEQQFNEILMKTGQPKFSGQEYNNVINKLREEGLVEEANKMEQNKIYQQAVQAQKLGKLEQFHKSLTKAKFNKNLSPETLINIEKVKTEVKEMMEDEHDYINKNEVIRLKSDKRYANTTLEEIQKQKAQIDAIKIHEEVDNILEKKLGIDDTFATVNRDNPTMMEYFKKNFDKLSPELQKYLLLDNQEKSAIALNKKLDDKIKEVTSYDHQTYLMNEEDYLKHINNINIKKFGRKMTSTDFKKVIEDKSVQKKAKYLKKERLEEIHKQAIQELESQEKRQATAQPQAPIEETPEVTPQAQAKNQALGNALQNVVINQTQNTIVPGDSENVDDVTIQNNDEIDFLPSDETTDSFKQWVEMHKAQENEVPTFEQFFDDAVKYLGDDKSKIGKNDLKAMGLSWEASGYGKSNWENIYTKHYTDKAQVAQNVLNKFLNTEIKPEVTNTEVAETNSVPAPKQGPINPLTGESLKITPVAKKTDILTAKANYNALEYKAKKEVMEDKDDNKIIIYTKQDTEAIPVLNETSIIDVKALLHPDKNNIGDLWTPVISTEKEWGDERLVVSVTDEVTGEISEYITFPEWIRRNQPKGMSLEQFQKTDEYIAKVPIFYQDAEGNIVSEIADTDWYNPLNVRDTSKDIGDIVYLQNPTNHHKKEIQKGKDNTFALRKQIANGTVKQVRIETKDGSPWIDIPTVDKDGNAIPNKTLAEVAPDSKIVFFKGEYFVNLDGSTFDLKANAITNLDKLKQDNKGTFRTFYLSPVNKSVDGQQRYAAIQVLRLNENGEQKAMSEDVESAKFILLANEVLSKKKDNRGFTMQEAQAVQSQVKLETGLDISDYNVALNMVNSMISLEFDTGKTYPDGNPIKKKYSAFNKDIPVPEKKGTYFIDALFSGKFTPVQNTNLSVHNNVGVSIKKTDNGFTVKKLGETYEDFLKTRLSTTKMSYNMGTEENPAYTHSVQPIIQVEPIVNESPTIVERVEAIEVAEITPDTKVEDINAEALKLLEELGGLEDVEDGDYLLPTVKSIKELSESLNIISTLSLDQQQDVVNYLLSSIAKNYDKSKEFTIGEFRGLIKQSFDNIFVLAESKLSAQYNNLNEVYQKNPEAFPQVLNTLKMLQLKKNKVTDVINNYDNLFSKAYLEGMRKGFIPSTVKTNEELQFELNQAMEDEMYEKDLYKSSNETIHKDKVSKKLRRLFATISNGQTGFLGLEKHESYDKMYNTIATMLTANGVQPSFNNMISRLELFNDVFPWMKPLTENLKKADEDTKASFVANMYKFAAKASFVAINDQVDGTNNEIWFSNANNIKQKIKEYWNNEFKRSNITNNSTLNVEKLKSLVAQWESWGENKHLQEDAVLRKWLADFGIVLSDGTWDELKKGNLVVNSGRKKRTLTFEDLFFDSSNAKNTRSSKLFVNLARFAEANMNGKQGELDFTENSKKYNPFSEMNNVLKSLIEIEANHNTNLINITRRDGDKTVSEVIFPNFFLHNVRKLLMSAENENGYIDDLMKTDFAANSLLLKLLKNNADFKDIFSYGEVGLMSMKKIGTKTPSFSKIEQLSPLDYMFHQRAMFQDVKTQEFEHKEGPFKMRIATVSTPTNSDKGRMMLLKTAVYDFFTNKDAFIKQGEDYNFSTEVKDLLYESLIVPELTRIVKHNDVNIKDYNKGAVRFNLIPEINTITNKSGVSVLDFLKNNKDVAEFKKQFSEPINTFLEASIKNEAKQSLTQTDGFVEKNNRGEEVDMFNNKAYLERREDTTLQDKRYLAELDYTINGMIANINTLQAIAGDPAMYYKSKGTNVSSDTNEQIKISKDLGTNLGKRLALMIAPGTNLSESQDEKYMQIFLQDAESVAQNAEQIIGWHYGTESLKEEFNGKTYEEHIKDLRTKSISDTNLKQLQLRFAKVKSFLQIEATDAQEYTTLKEHLRTLEGQGRITKEKADEIIKKSENGLSLMKDLDIILQPIKPVYTGDIIEGNIRRIVYIKSSSFPLIPDLVKGTALEGLMNKMNELEKKHGVNVRASYQSANKVGALPNAINPLDANSLATLDEVDQNPNVDKPANALLLDRINFKIQQDVPFKSDLQKEDKVSMGTQIFKLLFGDGITELDGFELNGKKVTGTELKKEFFNTFSSIINLQTDGLLEELGLDNEFKAENKEATAKKIQVLLKAEAEERGFSENDIKSLELDKKILSNGEIVHHFRLPLWFSGNSNKFESMLNAIINNRVFKQKLPGNSFVVGSENGITLRTQEEGIPNDIIYIGDYKGGELKGTEVLAPSKLKIDGKIIDLFKKNKNGKYIYIKESDNGYVINEQAIDPALFENFGFRTPTSSHGSASNIKIVGFIPAVMGDLMITPKNFIAQMGQDFDIDKLTSYQYHTFNNEGKFEKFNETHRDNLLAEFEKKNKDKKLVDNLLDAIGFEELDRNEMTYEKLERKLNLKLAQNKFIEIHNSVYTNPSADVQKKINKVLSMDFAEAQADAIDNLVKNDNIAFNILSPTYQMDKMIAGSTGSVSIGIYAKGVTFNSLAQQSDKPIQIQESFRDENDELYTVAKSYVFGNIVSNGMFGNLETLSANEDFETTYELRRRTAEVQDERVNTGTDNEKAQILGRVGITHIDAVAVDNFLSLLGIDAERTKITTEQYDASNPFHKTKLHNGEQIYYTEYSIPYLLHSQPIVKEYFKRLKNAKGITQEYQKDIDKAIFEELTGGIENVTENYNQNFTGENLISGITANNIESDFQKQILIAYKDLITDATKVKDLQSVIDMSNLGKSMWESKDNIEKFQQLSDNDNFSNIESLVGSFSKESGDIYLGDGLYFTPTTNQGVMVGTAVSLGRNLFFDYFPYYNSYISSIIETEILANSNVNLNNSNQVISNKEEIFEEMKKYITSATRNGIFLGTPSEERKSLFFDSEDNTSLSTYIAKLLENSSDEKGIKAVKSNSFLTYLNYEKGENGKPNLIKFDNTEVANVSEEQFHQSFKELFIKDIALPDKNGKPYSTRLLAQELVAYSHLSGGIVREAIEFHRFIPIEYYNSIYNATTGSTVTRALQNYDTIVSNWGSNNRLKNFAKQFFQNNPQKATQLDKTINTKVDKEYMYINDKMESYPKYVAVKNKTKSKLKQDKWSLYEQIKDGRYKAIDVLGEFGMSEYDYDSSNLKTSVEKPNIVNTEANNVVNLTQNVTPVNNKTVSEITILDSDNSQSILEKIKNNNISYNPALSDVAGQLLEIFKDQLLNNKIKVINDPNEAYKGRYKGSDGSITINLHNNDRIAETFIHEFVHSVTVSGLKPYYDSTWNHLTGEAPAEVMQLNMVFNEYKDKITKKYPKEIKAFQDKYSKYIQGEKVVFTPMELSVFYPTVNIKEFLAVSLSNNEEFVKETSQIPYKQSGMNIRNKFIKVLNALLSKLSGVQNNLAEQILVTNFQTIEALNNKVNQEVNAKELEKLQQEMIIQDSLFDPDILEEDAFDPDNFTAPENNDVSLLPDCI